MKKVILIFSFVACHLAFAEGVAEISKDTINGAAEPDSVEIVDSLHRSLGEVTVTASNIERKGNHDLITITSSMRKGAVNTVQMLGSIQGMMLNRADNSLKYLGSDKIIILVDSVEKDVDYVKNLNHLRFDKIDVIHHPSGKYSEYDVLINLRKKEVYEGYEGNLRVDGELFTGHRNGCGHDFGYGGESGSFTYTRGRWNFFVQEHFNWRDNASSKYSEISYPLNNYRDAVITNRDGSPNQRDYARNRGPYLGVDYDINKNHSVSLTYYLGTTSIDNYTRATMLAGSLDALGSDTLSSAVTFRDKGYRHTVGLYYRGRTGLWGYNANVIYTNNGWRTWSRNERSSGFLIEDNRRNQQNYTWGNAEVNRRTKDGKWYFALGYMNYWKEFWIKRLSTGQKISETVNRRNDLYLSTSFNPSSDWSMGLNGSVQFISNESDGVREDYVLNSFGGWLYRRFSGKVWARINYNSSYNQPFITQITDYGQFTDSLQWSGGNPALRAYTSHTVNVSIGLFNMLTLVGACYLAPDAFSQVAETREGMRPDGTYGPYVATQWQNTSYREWGVGISAYKTFGKFRFNIFAKWTEIRAEYKDFCHHKAGPSGNFMVGYDDSRRLLSIQLYYAVNNGYSASPQSESESKIDMVQLYVQKSFLKGRLAAFCSYIAPLHIMSGKSWTEMQSPAMHGYSYSNTQFRSDNKFTVGLIYRFSGGKSVRQYNREMRND